MSSTVSVDAPAATGAQSARHRPLSASIGHRAHPRAPEVTR